MKKLVINALSAQAGGGQTYLFNVFDSRHGVWDDYELIFLASESNYGRFKTFFGASRVFNVGKVGNHFLSRAIWENFRLSKTLEQLGANTILVSGGLVPFFPGNVTWIAVSHNLLPFFWKNIHETKGWAGKLRLFILRYAQLWTFNVSKGVIFTSHYSREIISSLLNRKITNEVIVSGINDIFFEDASVTNVQPYFLYVSTFFEYKHQLEVVQAFDLFLKENPNTPHELILVGSAESPYAAKTKELVQKLGLTEKVIFRGNVVYEKLPSLMQNSFRNIFASSCENCPNILLEYLASKTPIICSQVHPMPEFGENYVEYFNPEDPIELAAKLTRSLQNSSLEVNREAIKNKYNWKRTAQMTKNFIEELQMKVKY